METEPTNVEFPFVAICEECIETLGFPVEFTNSKDRDDWAAGHCNHTHHVVSLYNRGIAIGSFAMEAKKRKKFPKDGRKSQIKEDL